MLVVVALVERNVSGHAVGWAQVTTLVLDLTLIDSRRSHGPKSVMMVRFVSTTEKCQPLSGRGLGFHIIPESW